MRRSRSTVLVLILALAATVGHPTATAPPAVAATGTGACASHLVPATAFTDTLTSTHRAAIDCSAWWGLFQGTSPTTFTPAANVTRGQSAAVIARLLRTTGRAPASVPSAGFTDTVGHTFEADIDLLAHFGIVRGFTPTTYGPNLPIQRAHMAAIISRMFALGYSSPLPAGPVPFTDVSPSSPYYDDIGSLVAAGITAGTSPTTFSPTLPVLRGQMASFVTRSTDVLLTEGFARYPTARPGPNDAYASRMRGAWVHLFDGTLKTTAGVRRMVDELAAADVNVIIAQVIRRHDAYYPSTVLPRTTDPAVAPDFDLIAAVTSAAHARGIEVHAWFAVAPTYHAVYDSIPRHSPNWVYTLHGPKAPVADRWVTLKYDGITWTDYLDPGVPQVQDHVARVVGELAGKGVDGIHLDYVRYGGVDEGYNPLALAAFWKDNPAYANVRPAPTNSVWSSWRRAQTLKLVRRARAAIDASGRDVDLSAAVITWGDGPATADRTGFTRTSPYTRVFQDWDYWVRNGELDAVMPMNYFRAHDPVQATWFTRWLTYERALAAAAATQVVPGPAGYLNEPANVLAQVRAAMRVDGAMIYSYQQPTIDGSRTVWSRLSLTRWGYWPTR
jgi:uncharacterized lipoprotein YddW (UPF0748 family)